MEVNTLTNDFILISAFLLLYSFLKNWIGRDLTRITMPVTFNEPLSFTQVKERFRLSPHDYISLDVTDNVVLLYLTETC